MHMEHTIAKDAFSGLSGNNAVYNAICIAVCDDEQFMCDMIEEKIIKTVFDDIFDHIMPPVLYQEGCKRGQVTVWQWLFIYCC